MTKERIKARLDKLVDIFGERELECKSWDDASDRMFTIEQVHGTFDYLLDNQNKDNRLWVMQCANDLWEEAHK